LQPVKQRLTCSEYIGILNETCKISASIGR
jgi:hypothetical protein